MTDIKVEKQIIKDLNSKHYTLSSSNCHNYPPDRLVFTYPASKSNLTTLSRWSP
jgi:hypothetical protein